MKAQLFESKAKKEIRLANGVQFFAEAGESKEDFTARVTEAIDRDYVDTLDLEEIEPTKFKKYSVKQLQKMRPNKKGVELRMVQEVLVERGALVEVPEGGAIFNGTETDEDISTETPEAETPETPEAETPEAETPETTEAETPETPELKKLKKQMTDEEASIRLESAKIKIGRTVTFSCSKTKNEATGIVKGVRLDKRNNFIQYRILVETTIGEDTSKAMYGKGIDSLDLKFVE